MRSKTLLIGVIGIVIGVLLSTAVVFAGDLNPGSGRVPPALRCTRCSRSQSHQQRRGGHQDEPRSQSHPRDRAAR